MRRRFNERIRLVLERLEERLAPATTITVNDERDLGDNDLTDHKPLTLDGTVTLAAAIQQIEHDGGSGYVINFSKAMTFSFFNGLGVMKASVTINGFRENGVPAIKILSGSYFGNNCILRDIEFGAEVQLGNRNTLERCVIDGTGGSGITINGDNNKVRGCWVGLQPDGKTPSGLDVGITINGGNNTIGGATAAEGNVISGAKFVGVAICALATLLGGNSSSGNYNRVLGNRIGYSSTGDEVVTNGLWGAAVLGQRNQIGGLKDGEGNYIVASGPNSGGVLITDDSMAFDIPPFVDFPPSKNNTIQGNKIGTKLDGNSMFGNGDTPSMGTGIKVAIDESIVGTKITGNIVGDAATGIWVAVNPQTTIADSTLIMGNRVGVGLEFDAIPNTDGVVLENAKRNIIGDAGNTNRNYIGANTRDGLVIKGQSSNSIFIYNNAFGTDPSQRNLGNGVHAIHVVKGEFVIIGPSDNSAPKRNVFAFNGSKADTKGPDRGHAIQVDDGRVTLHANSFSQNVGLSFYLRDPVHPQELPQNDLQTIDKNYNMTAAADLDSGPNGLLNFPEVKSLNIPKKLMFWQYNGAPNSTFDIDFYVDSEVHPLGYGQGTTFLTTKELKTDATGYGEVSIPWIQGRLVTATVTDKDFNSSPFAPVDSDADGLADGWETSGIDLDMDGTPEQMLGGADPQRKDIFVEADVMDGAVAGATPLDQVFAKVAFSFANAPPEAINNPGGGGVRLHVNEDLAASTMDKDLMYLSAWPEFDAARSKYFGTGSDLKKRARAMAFRYCEFIYGVFDEENPLSQTLGLAENARIKFKPKDPKDTPNVHISGGNDFMVAMPPGSIGTVTVDDLAGSFMHELGHTLGLRHGGTDDVNFKPNYYSIMNYSWTYPDALHRSGQADLDYSSSWSLDYSRQALPNIDERSLSEATTELHGIAGKMAPVNTTYLDRLTSRWIDPFPKQPWQIIPQTGKDPKSPMNGKYIDWNLSNTLDAPRYTVDLNNDYWVDSTQTKHRRISVLTGAEDWSRLVYNFRQSPDSRAGQHGPQAEDHTIPRGTAAPLPAATTVIGADAGSNPRVQVLRPDGSVLRDFNAFDPTFQGGVRVAQGDVNGDGTLDVIAAMGPTGDTVRAFSGVNGTQLWSVTPYGAGFAGGLNVAAGDINGDGHAEVFVAPASGVGSTVQILSGADGSKLRDILAYANTTKGGVTLAAGDVNGDGKADVITGLAVGSNPLIKVFNAADGKVIKSFNASSPSFNGVWLAAADVDHDGFADIIAGAGAGTATANAPEVRIYSGKTTGKVLQNYLAGAASFHGGVRVAAVKLLDGNWDIVLGMGPGQRLVKRVDAALLTEHWSEQPFDAGFNGAFVG